MRAQSREFYDEAKMLAAAKKYNGAASRLYFPEVFGKSTVASAKSKTSKLVAKRSKSRASKERFATAKN